MGASRRDTDSQVSHVEASLGYQRHHARWSALHLDSGARLQRRRYRPLSQASLRQIAGKIMVIWDGLPAHRGKVVKAFLAGGATKWLHLERLPGYAPDLNPDEGVWH